MRGNEALPVRTKRVYQGSLASDCWPVQVWGLPYGSGFGDYGAMCECLATGECGGQAIRKRMLTGDFSLSGLPDAGAGPG